MNWQQEPELYDMTIIGGGTAGMYAAYYAGMRGMSVKIIDCLPFLGGTVTAFYPEKMIYDIGGIPKISGADFISQMEEQALMFNPSIIMNRTVKAIGGNADASLSLTLENGDVHHSKTVLIAAGPGVITKRERKDVYFCDPAPIEAWGFPLERRRIPVSNDMETQMPHVYVAGDMAGYTGKWRLIASAYTEAVTAVNHAKTYLDPSAPAQVYSSLLLDP
ncbi:hypothetical protein GCM10028778_12850 [Barrientosiimonas marina]|uniref:NAD(P)/FAD-dependent oxidoreductase n=1 Tax=Lentibacillus kimchii TaxID=1542911 RepID=A0ABW2UR78_9BACI